MFYENILLLFKEEARAGTFLSAKDGGSSWDTGLTVLKLGN